MGEPPRRRLQPLPHKLEQLQRCGRAPPLFTAVPHSGLTPIEAMLDEASDLKSVVLLGFTRDGCHLVSYTTQPAAAADGQDGYSLQLWSFAPGARCRRLWSVPLFRTQPYLDALADEEGFLSADDMLLTVAEPPDSSLLVVHGRSSDPADGTSREYLVNYLTLIPGPLHAGAAQMQVAHLSYHTAFPHTPFNPYHFLAPLESGCLPGADTPGSSSGSSIIALAMYSGGGVRYLHAAVGRQPAQGVAVPSTQPLSGATSEEGEEDSSTSNFPPPDATAAMVEAGGESPAGQRSQAPPPAAAVEAGTQQREQTTSSRNSWPPVEQQRAGSPAGSPWPRQRRRTPRRPPPCPSLAADSADCELGVRYTLLHSTHAAGRSGGSSWQAVAGSSVSDASGCAAAAVSCTAAPAQLDLEACIFAALQQQGLPPGALLDYAAAPIQACSWQGREGLLLLAVLRLSRAQPQENYGGQQQQQQRQGQQATRSACVLLHASAASGKAAAVEWLEPPYPWHDDLSAFLVQQTAFAGLAFEKAPAFFADFMRARWGAPPPRWRLPLVLTNRSVLGSGQSLQHIAHPWLPQAILGYGSDL